MMNEEKKRSWIQAGIIALITFLVAYLAFYIVLKCHFKNLNNPFYQAEKMEKMIQKDFKRLDAYEKMTDPFTAKIRPTFINLVKEPSEYKIIIDLKQIDANEDIIDIQIQNNELTIKGEVDNKVRGQEEIIKFTQTYYLDEKVNEQEIAKERKGDKYIINLPFEIEED